MRIALTNPTTWPYVRRGAERFMNELAVYLGRRGHEVTVISSKPGRGEVRQDDGYTTRMHRRMWHPGLQRVGVLEAHAFMLTCMPRLLAGSFDVIQSCTFMDTFTATVCRNITGTPCVYWTNSLPLAFPYVRSLSTGGKIHRRAMRNADQVITLSQFMRDCIRERYRRTAIVLPPPVDLERFTWSAERDHSRPVIACAAALDDERKGVRLLMRAFNLVKRNRPECRLHLCSRSTQNLRSDLLELVEPAYREDVWFMPDSALGDLPRAFVEASVTVLPSISEWFGMVVVESMATGTPVVCTRHGALPELITHDGVGRLFDPGEIVDGQATNVKGLAQALLETLDLSQLPETARACRTEAAKYSWDRIGPMLENIYSELAGKEAAVAVGRYT
jgi:glycosyltransferase involved in cell wall biosynthesis